MCDTIVKGRRLMALAPPRISLRSRLDDCFKATNHIGNLLLLIMQYEIYKKEKGIESE